jgi:hypothetical protein
MTIPVPDGETAAIEPDGSITVPAAPIAAALLLTPDVFMRRLSGGRVSHVTEAGRDEDEGRHRLTFQYRGRQAVAVIGPTGELISCERTA